MNEVKHTPGPWTVGPRGASVYGPDNIRLASLDSHATTLGQRRANALLIAAAPDLLAALEKMLAAARCGYLPDVVLAEYGAQADAALAKAKGN